MKIEKEQLLQMTQLIDNMGENLIAVIEGNTQMMETIKLEQPGIAMLINNQNIMIANQRIMLSGLNTILLIIGEEIMNKQIISLGDS